MYTGLRHLHSGLRYVILLLLIIAIVSAVSGLLGKKEYTEGNRKLNLFTFIFSHVQLLVGLVLYFVSSKVDFSNIGSNSGIRYWTVEHITMMIIAIVLITIGYSKSKKALTSEAKFKKIAVFYTLALLIILLVIFMAVGKGLITFWGF